MVFFSEMDAEMPHRVEAEIEDHTYNNVLYQTLMFEGMLSNFSDDRLRSAFLRGRLEIQDHSRAMLESIDMIKFMMMPPIYNVGNRERDVCALSGVVFFVGMLDKSNQYPVDNKDCQLPVVKTYREWFQYFEELSAVLQRGVIFEEEPALADDFSYSKAQMCDTSSSLGDSFREFGSTGGNQVHSGFVKESSDHQLEGTNEREYPCTNGIRLSGRSTSSDALEVPTARESESEHGKKSLASDGIVADPSVRPKTFVAGQGKSGPFSVPRCWDANAASAVNYGYTDRSVADRGIRYVTGEDCDLPGYSARAEIRKDSRFVSAKLPVSETKGAHGALIMESNHRHTGKLPSRDPRYGHRREPSGFDTGDAPNSDLEGEFKRLKLSKGKSRKGEDYLNVYCAHRDVPFPKPKTGTREYVARRSSCDPKDKEKQSGGRKILSSSDPSSTLSDTGSSGTVSDTSEASRRGNRHSRNRKGFDHRLLKALSVMKPQRDAVPPGLYDMKDGTSLNRYLKDFEDYFMTKYEGSDRQMGKHLSSFLTGPIKLAYEAIGGPRLKFSSLKPKLLEWYHNERPSRHQKHETEFSEARMCDDEMLSIFAMRLERVAALVFKDEKERERQLCRKFWKEVPKTFSKVLSDSERSLALLSGKKKLSWSSMKRLAEAEDRQSKRHSSPKIELPVDRNVWLTKPESCTPTEGVGGSESNEPERKSNPSKTVRFPDPIIHANSGSTGFSYSSRSPERPSSFHTRNDRYFSSSRGRPGLNRFGVESNRRMDRNTNDLDMQRRRPSGYQGEFDLGNRRGSDSGHRGRSSFRGFRGTSRQGANGGTGDFSNPGGSLNEVGPKLTGSKVICDWCGRTGHIESDCWRKLGYCTSCGGTNHDSVRCNKYTWDRQDFQPRCSRCGGEHYGIFCPDSNLEN